MLTRITALLATVAIAAGLNGCSKQLTYADDVEFMLKENCGECHTGHQLGVMASGFSLDTYETLMHGTTRGPVIVAGSSASSTLYQMASGQSDVLSHVHRDKLPLSTAQAEVIKNWIDRGAVK